MNTALIISGMALAFMAGVFCSLKSVQLGLKWRMQGREGKSPTLEIPNPIKERREAKLSVVAQQQTNDIVSEWLNGAKEGG